MNIIRCEKDHEIDDRWLIFMQINVINNLIVLNWSLHTHKWSFCHFVWLGMIIYKWTVPLGRENFASFFD